jgi:hypothetical protein
MLKKQRYIEIFINSKKIELSVLFKFSLRLLILLKNLSILSTINFTFIIYTLVYLKSLNHLNINISLYQVKYLILQHNSLLLYNEN